MDPQQEASSVADVDAQKPSTKLDVDAQKPSTKLDDIRKQVSTATAIVAENVDKLMERDFRLKSIKRRSEELKAASEAFQLTARKAQQREWWRDSRYTALVAGLTALLLILVVYFALRWTGAWN